MTILPCRTCPWRKSTPKNGFPGGFIDMKLIKIDSGEDPAIMQCHCSPDGAGAKPCVGFVLQVRLNSIGILAMAIGGRIRLEDYGTDEPLHSVFSMIMLHNSGGDVEDEEDHG